MNSSYFQLMNHSIIRALFAICLLGLSSHAQAKADLKYSGTSGKIKSCPVVYPATEKRVAGQYNVAKKGCWSCPKGYKRSKNPLPDKGSSCKKRNVNKFAKKSTVPVKWGACKGKDVWKRNDTCWTCPAGYKRSLKLKDGKPVCKPNKKYKYSKAVKRGEAQRACPKGFIRNPGKSIKSKQACMGMKHSVSRHNSFIITNQSILQEKLTSASDLIALLNNFKQSLAPVIERKGITNVTQSDLRAAGAIDIMDRGCGQGYGSYTITVGGDGAYILGGNASGGIAFGRVDGCETGSDDPTDWNMTWIAAANVSGGVSAGVDGGINVGFWRSRFDDLHGYAWGLVGGGAVGPIGGNISGWWGIDWKPGRTGDFLGVSIGYQGGMSVEGEANWGYTFQKQTFNNCKNVKVKATNKTGKEIKVIDVDYHDYYKAVWRSEPTKNTMLANNKTYTQEFNFNQVDHAYTQMRVKYRKKESDGGWSSKVYRDWSGKSLCTDGKTYVLDLKE